MNDRSQLGEKGRFINKLMQTLEQTIPTLDINKTPTRKINKSNAHYLAELSKKSPMTGKHGKHKATLTKEAAWRQAEQAIIDRTMKLANAQSMLGLGTIQVFRVDAHYEMFGKTKKLIKDKPVIVDDVNEIIEVLNYEYANGDDPSTPEDDTPKFYFVETKEANNQAIDSQLNRIYGKAKETIDHKNNGKDFVPVIVGMQIMRDNKKEIQSSDDSKVIDI